jgi:hypothetical protein
MRGWIVLSVLALLGISWLRDKLGLTWGQFGFVSIAIPTAIILIYFALRPARQAGEAPAGDGDLLDDDGEDAPDAFRPAPKTRTPRAVPEGTIIRPVPKDPLWLRYRDASGGVSERVVIPRSLHRTLGDGGQLLRPRLVAYCTERKAVRSFMISRIDQAAFAETGELIPSVGTHLGVDRV